MKQFCIRNSLCMSSTYFDYPPENRYTWYSCDGRTKRVNDYVLVEKYVQEYVTQCKAEPDINFDSDHRIKITFLDTPMTRRARWKVSKHPTKRSINVKSLEDEKVKDRFIINAENELAKNLNIHATSVSEIATNLTKSLKTAAEITLPSQAKHFYKTIWRDDKKLNELLDKRMNLSTKSEEHKKVTKELKKRVKHLRNMKLWEEANAINENINRRQIEELYRNVGRGNTSFTKIKDKYQCDPTKLKDHFKQHFNLNRESTVSILASEIPHSLKLTFSNNQHELHNEPPSVDELKSTIKSLKNGKSANDIPAAYVKHAIESKLIEKEFTRLFKQIWKTNQIPENWEHTKLVALWKGQSKGGKKDPKAYRGLQIGSSMCKILVNLIINRLKTWYESQLMDQQQGFRSGRGTTDAIYIIKRIHEITDKMKKPVYVLFVDLASAFDHVDRKLLFTTIRHRLSTASNTKLIKILESLYSYTITALAQNPNDKFEITNGVRQGGPESPVLFNLFIDFIMHLYLDECERKEITFLCLKYKIPSTASQSTRTTLGEKTIDWIGYADDLAIPFDNKESLQLGADLLFKVFERYNLQINLIKTKTMIFNHQYSNEDYPNTISTLNQMPIENVKIYDYLGCVIKYDEPSACEAELQLRIDAAQSKFYEVGKYLMNFRIALDTRVKLLNSLVCSRLTYSCQTWTITTRQVNHLNSIYVSMLRKMIRGGYRRKEGTYHFELTNKNILEKSKTDDVTKFISKAQQRFVAHVIRGDNNRITKCLMFNDDIYRKKGYQNSVYKSVLKNVEISPDELHKNSLLRLY